MVQLFDWILLQVTFVEALDGLMPGFDPEIGKLAQRILIQPRKIDYHVGVLAKKVWPMFLGQGVLCFFVSQRVPDTLWAQVLDSCL
jgi:dihydrolipoamide dehydrogenase